jgi:hypothetical protein
MPERTNNLSSNCLDETHAHWQLSFIVLPTKQTIPSNSQPHSNPLQISSILQKPAETRCTNIKDTVDETRSFQWLTQEANPNIEVDTFVLAAIQNHAILQGKIFSVSNRFPQV